MSRVLIVGDPHCPGMHIDYPDFCSSIKRRYRCDTVVVIGDLLDLHGMSYHQKEEGMPSMRDEIDLAKQQVKTLYRKFPDAHWMLGNHDSLPTRKTNDAGIPEDMLRDPGDYWGVPNWQIHERYSWLEIDNVLYGHGEAGSGGKTPALNQATQQFKSVVIGHYHASFGCNWIANHGHCIFGMNVGTGMDHKYLGAKYGRKFPKKPIVGCGVVIDGVEPHCHRMML